MTRKAPVRTQDAQINIRLKTDQKTRLELAAKKMVSGVPGGRVAVSQWLLELGLKEADRILAK